MKKEQEKYQWRKNIRKVLHNSEKSYFSQKGRVVDEKNLRKILRVAVAESTKRMSVVK
jgi:hypothetical protein